MLKPWIRKVRMATILTEADGTLTAQHIMADISMLKGFSRIEAVT